MWGITVPSYRYGTGTMTRQFVDRIFQECLTYEGEVVCSRSLPKEHITPSPLSNTGLQDLLGLCVGYGEQKRTTGTPFSLPPPVIFSTPCIYQIQALQYLFRLLDIRGQGYLDSFTLNYFFRVSKNLRHCMYVGYGLWPSPFLFSGYRLYRT